MERIDHQAARENLSFTEYSAEAGKITLHGNLFLDENNYEVIIAATGYSNAVVQQRILSQYGANLALNKPTFSSGNAKQPSNNATDGNKGSRWESAAADNQFITVDLGTVYDITHVHLNWENAAAKSYDVLISVDGSTWTKVNEQNEREAEEKSIYLVGNGTRTEQARYVKIDCHTRTTQHGFSLWEFEVYGDTQTSAVSFAPALKPDATANVVGQPIDITFEDDTRYGLKCDQRSESERHCHQSF